MGARPRAGPRHRRTGQENWYFIATDYAFGHDLENQASEAVIEGGGRVLASIRCASIGTADFSFVPFAGGIGNSHVVALANALI